MAYKFVIKKDKKDEFRVNFVASNGETMFSTEGYASKASAKNAIESILKNGPTAEVVDETLAG
ncbi:YegP family protein [Caulobacter sp. DWR2-3-1b2]|uniref:YegP family protein n=1 Tax=unclassified Caulobacter TaxID=2648921 RepID=UPI0019C503DC|nr:YegP family protein [Caulobacter sp.]